MAERSCLTDPMVVLDHGFVRYIDHMGSDLSVVRNARVSHDAAWRAGEDEGSDERLIRYLMKNGHNTPFEACTLTVEVKAPIFVLRQWHRHRTQSYNELSARYRPLPEEFYLPNPEIVGRQSMKNHQARDLGVLSDVDRKKRADCIAWMKKQNHEAFELYQTLLRIGMPRELARSVLPVSTYSHMFATANLHNWFRFLRERNTKHAQYEIQVYAVTIESIVAELFPVCYEAYCEG